MWDQDPLPLDADELDDPGTDDERVLVVIVTRAEDWERIRAERWYRIPVRRAPSRLGAGYLAFYLGKAAGPDRWSIPAYASVRGYRLVQRRDLLPEEADHPRAEQWYYRVALGPLQSLARPIPSAKLRRIAFIPTTLERLLRAREINDLWDKEIARDRLWRALKRRGLSAYRDYEIEEGLVRYQLDIAEPCVTQGLGVRCVSVEDPDQVRDAAPMTGWSLCEIPVSTIMTDLPGCVTRVERLAAACGGPETVPVRRLGAGGHDKGPYRER